MLCSSAGPVIFDSQLVSGQYLGLSDGVSLEVWKYQITDWLDRMTGSEKVQ